MKPRIKRQRSIWYCTAPYTHCGLGYTPAGAHADWKNLNKKIAGDVDWGAVGRIIEAHSSLRGVCVPGTSNWAAAIWRAARGIQGAKE